MQVSADKKLAVGFFSNSKTSFILFLLSLLTFIYWFGALIIEDVYKFKFIGAVYEILWLPMLLLLIAIPIVAVFILVNRNSKKLLAVLSILLMVGTFIVLSRV
jgi:Ni/Fe-hydrogenase subunit HybB-like protein